MSIPQTPAQTTTTPETWRGAYVMRVPFISTAHITAADGAKLRQNDPRDVLAKVIDTGHIIYFGDDDINAQFAEEYGFSQPFRDLLHTLAADGFTYVRLDCDGDVIPGLPTFE
jgi:hypothetical protein